MYPKPRHSLIHFVGLPLILSLGLGLGTSRVIASPVDFETPQNPQPLTAAASQTTDSAVSAVNEKTMADRLIEEHGAAAIGAVIALMLALGNYLNASHRTDKLELGVKDVQDQSKADVERLRVTFDATINAMKERILVLEENNDSQQEKITALERSKNEQDEEIRQLRTENQTLKSLIS